MAKRMLANDPYATNDTRLRRNKASLVLVFDPAPLRDQLPAEIGVSTFYAVVVAQGCGS